MKAPLVDSFGRVVKDLRISVTDRCNLRCTYCMPAEGLPWTKKDDLLSTAEIERLARLFVGLGIEAIKVTGGEPTARAELVEIVASLRGLGDRIDLSMTTNGLVLDRLAAPLKDAGLDRLTVSCDSLLRHRFADMTRRDCLDQVMKGIGAASEAGFHPLKVNCVVIGGTNDDEVVDFAAFARHTGCEVRFIEYMPLDAEDRWERSKVVSSSDLIARISGVFPLVPAGNGGPARSYRFTDGAPGNVGFISSVSEPFCAACDRVRLTSDGRLRSCLFSLEETDVRDALRAGATDDELEDAVRRAISEKWAGHRIGAADFVRPGRSMSQIGG